MSLSPVAVGRKHIRGKSLSERLRIYLSIKEDDRFLPKPPPPIAMICLFNFLSYNILHNKALRKKFESIE